MDKVAVSRAVSRLVERALVEQVAQADDRRSRRLSLTDSGRALYGQVAPKALELEAQLLTEFSQEEVGELSAMLVRLEAAAAGVARALRQSGADATVART
jgi:DNA-binding MarR family transcriptional regulator